MRTIHFFILFFVSLLLYYCSPKSVFVKPAAEAKLDSVLYYEQADLADPLLDEIRESPGDEALLSTRLTPPPPGPSFREIEGFRVQVFAGIDSLGATTIKYQVARDAEDPAYLIYENGLYKIQVGNYPYRMDADQMKLRLNQKGYDGAWVVKRLILIAEQDSLPAAEQPVEQPVTQETGPPAGTTEGAFRIQVLATGDPNRAQELAAILQNQFNFRSFYESSGMLHKVFIGNFQTRGEAETMLRRVRENGYPDAWLVY